MIMTAKNAQRGFSLVELSIVLVILGLLTGGILAGQSLIRAAELRAVNTEFQRYSAAISSFRDKYFALPGDFTKASGTGGFGWTDAAGNATAVGDGDGAIRNTAAAGTNEIAAFWTQLSNAGLIEGSNTNIGGTTLTIGTNNSRSKVTNAAWNVICLGVMGENGVSVPTAGASSVVNTTYFDGVYGNVLAIGSGTNALAPGAILKSEEAWNIDTKMDDALPDQGGVRTLESQGNATAGSGCTDRTPSSANTTLAASSYDLTSTGINCSMVFKTGY